MSDHSHHHGRGQEPHRHTGHGSPSTASLNRVAFQATVHCLTGCAIGEVLGMVIGTAWGLSNLQTIGLAVILAFFFGYALTLFPLVRIGMVLSRSLRRAFAAETNSIPIMDVVDNLLMLAIPGAMHAGPTTLLFWASLAFALAVAGIAAYPVNRWLISRGRGHAVVHGHH